MGQQTVEFQAINYYWTLGNLNRDLDFNVRSMSIDLFGLFNILLQKIRYQCFDDVFECDKSSILHIFLEQLTEKLS